ncbi:dynamin family protein [Anabaena cylindrica UHCC 0172]|uniref:dynamin family protein n=1 Tax=Anabaena cylindrica TaxID=1165 RepID=UPI002B20DE1A|nr:dynamin family protein [Anabaena cylindrica]MEA5554402.1 dynamin family protein [Anabaena cylindrica UHCC 0172]
MYSDLIEATRNEVLRLIDKQSEMLDGLLTIPNLLLKSSGDRQQGIDSQTVKNWQNVLANEKKKVENLEMVLAVVGIMKAGKSTTINAISGSEILPNRNQPMTTLPTLIRHSKGKKDPVLTFVKRQPVEEMVNEVKKKLKELKQAGNLDLVNFNNEKDGQGLINNILNSNYGYFKERYEGQKQIFEFLQKLNDLVRLAQDPYIDIEFPIEEYEDLNDLPFIEVEFIHLANLQEVNRGTISLLDTPGPNEYGQGDKLRKILDAQIVRASAVLMIVDYNNLKSEAEGEIRDRLEGQTGLIADRLFTIVNKFDQKDTNSMNENEVKQYVANTLMQRKIFQERVYPASARNGYLANRAKQEIDKNGNLPDNDENGWVDDFGKIAFGNFWDVVKGNKDQNIEMIKSMIPIVWEKSRFETPLKEAIVKASGTATLVSMQSATAKMLDLGNRLDNFLEVSRGTFTKTVQEIREIVNELEKDVKKVEEAENQAEDELLQQLDHFLDFTQTLYNNTKQELGEILKNFFKYGKLQEEIEYLQKQEEIATSNTSVLEKIYFAPSLFIANVVVNLGTKGFKNLLLPKDFKNLFSDLQNLFSQDEYKVRRRTNFEFDPSNPRITFYSEKEAGYFIEKINREINLFTNDAEQKLESAMKILSKHLEQKIRDVLVRNVGEILDEARQKLKHDGFSVNFLVPEPDTENNRIDFSSLVLESIENITNKTEDSKLIEKKGFWVGKVGRGASTVVKWGTLWLWQPKWGYEKVSIKNTETLYVVDIQKLEKSVLENLESTVFNLGSNNQNFFESAMKPIIDNYFDGLKNYLKEFRGTMIDSINNHRLDEKSIQELMQQIIDMKKKVIFHNKDVEGIEKGLKELK